MRKVICSVRRFSLGAVCLFAVFAANAASTFTIGTNDFQLAGKPFLIKAGEMHPSRVPPQYWADRLRMIHAMGLNTVSIYVFWNVHEPREGEFNFSGDADIAG